MVESTSLASTEHGRKSFRSIPSVEGKVAVLTIGTSSDEEEGFQEAVDLGAEFVKHGCRLVVAGSPLPRVTEARDKIFRSKRGAQQQGQDTHEMFVPSVQAVELSTSRGEQAVTEAVEQAWSAFGGIDILVCPAMLSGAGVATRPALETYESHYDEIVARNLKAGWLLSKIVAAKMKNAARHGSILFITSISGTERGFYPGVSIYAASLAATNHLAKMMGMELGKFGVRVNAIACGLTDSNVAPSLQEKESAQDLARNIVPLQRWARFPSDISGVMLWLASDSSTFVTGTVTIVDGGQSLRRARMGEYRSRLIPALALIRAEQRTKNLADWGRPAV